MNESNAPRVTYFRWWIGNSLTVLRLVAGIAYPFVAISWRLPILIYCAFSDLVDGAISRALGATSLTGQVLDPIADKVCVAAVLLTAIYDGELRIWEFVFLAARDLAVAVIAVIAHVVKRTAWQEMPPRLLGKLATAGQFAFLLNIVSGYERVPGLLPFAGLTSVAAGIDYAFAARRAHFGHTPPRQST